ncbi:hypothetical protein JB92DRAFT_3013031 [Gautieria morchelliformis]|nr:hypothetical protein JB92DRAFT_3013031 [Gautieria morchelliformis]
MQNPAGSSSVANPSSDIPPRPLRRPTVVASGPAQVNPPVDPPRSGRIPANDRAQTFLDPPPMLLAKPSRTTPLSKVSPQPSPARKRCRSPAFHSGGESPRYKARCRQDASKVLEAIGKVLECPICYDTIAAPHLLTCGHSACGLCLCEWIRRKGANTRCYICRAPHRGSVLPNYALDDMASTYFSERSRIAQEGPGEADGDDRKQWEKRKADGKAAVQVAQKHFIKAPQPPMAIRFDPDDEAYDLDFYEIDNENPYEVF